MWNVQPTSIAQPGPIAQLLARRVGRLLGSARAWGWLGAVALACAWGAPALAQRSTPIQLLHPAGVASDAFGTSVAIDGDTMVIGHSGDDVGSVIDQGSAHVYRWTGSGWVHEAMLTAADGAAGDRFGVDVAISGDTVVVGSFLDTLGANASQGSAYVFVRSGSTWSQQAKLTAADGVAFDEFGGAVAILDQTIVVGSPRSDIGSNSAQGSAYVFVRAGTTWTQRAKLTAADGALGDLFGGSVDLSADTLIIGADGCNIGGINDVGAAYVFTRSGASWTQQAKLTASDGAVNDTLGTDVAIDGETAIVAARSSDVGGNPDQGAAYIFVRSGSTWTQQAKLLAPDGVADDRFGSAVAISRDTVLVGADLDDVGTSVAQGSAYVFTRQSSAWTMRAQLTAPGGVASDRFGAAVALSGDTAVALAPLADVGSDVNEGSAWVFSRVGNAWIGPDLSFITSGTTAGDNLGTSVAVSGDTAVIGAPGDDVGANADQGSVKVFVRDPGGTRWVQQAQLLATNGAAGDAFGTSVAISGDTVVVGAPLDDNGTLINRGSAYVFTRAPGGTTWTQQSQLTPGVLGASEDRFGISVAVDGDTALVGAYLDTVGGIGSRGSAFVFFRTGTSWSQQAFLSASDGAANDLFGQAVALSGDTALIGAPFDDTGANDQQGSAYVFTRSGTAWSQQTKLTASDGALGDFFGFSVAIEGNTAVVGAYLDDIGADFDEGSAYVFTRSGSSWSQQARLVSPDGIASDFAGSSVAISGNTVLVGAPGFDVGPNSAEGSVLVFTRSGSVWIQQARILSLIGGNVDIFGQSVALSGVVAFVGSPDADANANVDSGRASKFDIAFDDLSKAHNDTTNTSFSSLGAAIAPALSGHQITATEAVWRTATSVSTAGKSLLLRSTSDLRTPATSSIILHGTSSLTAPTGGVMELFGAVETAPGAASSLSTDAFTLGSRGTLALQANTSFTIQSPIARLVGRMDLQSGATLTATGTLFLSGPIGTAVGATVVTGGSFDSVITENSRYDMDRATLRLAGTGSEQTLEVMSRDIGPVALGLDRTLPGHFPIGTLRIGPSASTVRLVDAHDNDGLGQGACEAIYVNTLRIEAGSRLINPTCKIYCLTLVNSGVIDFPANVVVIAIPPECDTLDFNQDGDFPTPLDLEDFINANAGSVCGTCSTDLDFNNDGDFPTPLDIEAFISVNAGGPCL